VAIPRHSPEFITSAVDYRCPGRGGAIRYPSTAERGAERGASRFFGSVSREVLIERWHQMASLCSPGQLDFFAPSHYWFGYGTSCCGSREDQGEKTTISIENHLKIDHESPEQG